MQIVINIPDEHYVDVMTKLISKTVHFDDYELREMIRKGTVLPRKHGRLIDADELIKQLEATANKMDS